MTQGMPKQPNIVLIITDQQRGDCLGVEDHPVLQTPSLDYLATSGTRFTNAYSACPVCIPARRTLMSGQRPATHGVLGNYETWLKAPTLMECLRDSGYQTQLCGKLHFWPLRAAYGFEGMKLSDGPGCSRSEGNSDYVRFMRREGKENRAQMAHGVEGESCFVRPWHLEERLHVANWATDNAIEFLETRDPTRPFFLNLSFFHPHPPITPPQFFYDRYLNLDIPEPVVGDWARIFDTPQTGRSLSDPRQYLDDVQMKQYRAAYYAAINHIDNQVQRLLNAMAHTRYIDMDNTLFVFLSDHGDMLGDHQWHRKSVPYQGAVRVPFLVKLPAKMGVAQNTVINKPVELMDVMPTILDVARVDIPDTVEGRSVLPLIQGEDHWRPYVHGEIWQALATTGGMQYLTDGKRKYIWFPAENREQYFNLEADPSECHELSADPAYAEEIALWRQRLVHELTGRPEGFTDGESLLPLEGPTTIVLPGFERNTDLFQEGIEGLPFPL